MKLISNHLFLVFLALLAIAVTGLIGSPLRLKSSQQTDIENHGKLSDLRNKIKARERHHYNGHDDGYHAPDKHNNLQLPSAFEWPKQQYESVAAYNPYNSQPQKPYSSLHTPSYDPSSFIYPLVYYTEPPTHAAYTPPFLSTPAYPQSPFSQPSTMMSPIALNQPHSTLNFTIKISKKCQKIIEDRDTLILKKYLEPILVVVQSLRIMANLNFPNFRIFSRMV
ncbi:uncharacterized protein LOC116925664 [Daphnia magna]|uniref:uncharacterized protein LOC116925664 n=1 Tax=Daphnia magna TaxID=35525 RepID=UPI001E1BD041|nr:uncharacterized protein LOC116925664 [Daphnia magna]